MRSSGTSSHLGSLAVRAAPAGVPFIATIVLIVGALFASYDVPKVSSTQFNFFFGPVTQSMVVVQTLNAADPISRVDLRIRSEQPTVAVLAIRATTNGRSLRSVTRRVVAGDRVYAFRFPTVFPTVERPIEFALALPDQPAANLVTVAAHSRDVFPAGRAYVPGFTLDAGVDLQFRTFQDTSLRGVMGEFRRAFTRSVLPARAAVMAFGAAYVLMTAALGVAGGAALRQAGIRRPYVTAVSWTLLILTAAAVSSPLTNPLLGSL